MTDDLTRRLLCRAAAQAEARPAYLAAIFARYRAIERLDNEGIARQLGIAPDRLCALALCLRPRAESFLADVAAIAGKFGIAPGRLAAVIRHVDALAALGNNAAADRQTLAAAREAEDEPVQPEDDAP